MTDAASFTPNPVPEPRAVALSRCEEISENGLTKEVSIVDVATALHGGEFQKREFESTQDYEKRLSGRLNQVKELIKRKTGRDELVFSIPVPSSNTKYNADLELMTIGREYSGLLRTGYNEGQNFVIAKSSERAVGTYIGENAFGAKRQIIKSQGYAIGFSAPGAGFSSWPESYASDSFKPFDIRMTRDEARKAKEDISVLFVGQLRAPYLINGRDRFTPKIDAPFDTTTANEVVQVEVQCAAIYNRATKKIIRTLNLPRNQN